MDEERTFLGMKLVVTSAQPEGTMRLQTDRAWVAVVNLAPDETQKARGTNE